MAEAAPRRPEVWLKDAAKHLTVLSAKAYAIARSRGFTGDPNPVVDLALIHSEVSEALEAIRDGNPPSEHIPEFSALEEELADTVIRVLCTSGRLDLRLGEAVLAKMAFNESRPTRHGRKAF